MAAMSPHFHRLAPRQLQLAQLYVAGKTNAEIAAEMGVRLVTVDGMLATTRACLEGRGRYTPKPRDRPINPANDAPPSPPPSYLNDEDLARLNTTGVERAREKMRVLGGGRVGPRTIAPGPLTRDERQLSELLVSPDVDRPLARGDCEDGRGRPCPFVSCSHHLYLDVNPETGAIKLNFPHLEVWEMAETCSLDVADRGGITLEEVGAILNLTRERIRQVEVRGLERIRKHGGDMEDARVQDHSPLGSVMA